MKKRKEEKGNVKGVYMPDIDNGPREQTGINSRKAALKVLMTESANPHEHVQHPLQSLILAVSPPAKITGLLEMMSEIVPRQVDTVCVSVHSFILVPPVNFAVPPLAVMFLLFIR